MSTMLGCAGPCRRGRHHTYAYGWELLTDLVEGCFLALQELTHFDLGLSYVAFVRGSSAEMSCGMHNGWFLQNCRARWTAELHLQVTSFASEWLQGFFVVDRFGRPWVWSGALSPSLDDWPFLHSCGIVVRWCVWWVWWWFSRKWLNVVYRI